MRVALIVLLKFLEVLVGIAAVTVVPYGIGWLVYKVFRHEPDDNSMPRWLLGALIMLAVVFVWALAAALVPPWIEANAGFADKILGKQPEVVEWDVLECAEVTEIKFGAWLLSTNGVTACSGDFLVAHYEKSSPAILKVHMDRVRATNGTVELYWDNGTRILPED